MVDEAIAWLEKNGRSGPPFLLWLDSFQPHEPWAPPEPYRGLYQDDYRGRFIPLPSGPSVDWMTPRELQHTKGLHMGEVTYTDTHVGRLLTRLDELGLSEDTFVFVVSDHGMPFGEHGTIRKFGVPVYDELAKTVWIMRKPGLVKGGIRVKSLVQTTDFLPTVLELCGMEAPVQHIWFSLDGLDTPGVIDGASLAPILTGEATSVRDTVYNGAFALRSSIRRGPWKMIDNRGEKPNELFNLDEDPLERDNRHDGMRGLADDLHRELWEFQTRWGSVLAWRDQPARADEPANAR
jgi:arylsulfatase A-like enzyme